MGDQGEKESGGQSPQGFKGYDEELEHCSLCRWKQLDDFRQRTNFVNDCRAAGWTTEERAERTVERWGRWGFFGKTCHGDGD